MDSLVIDVVNVIQIATRETKQRLAAAKNLPQLSQRCLDTIQQIEGIVKNVPGDDSTKVTLAGIQRDLETLGTLVEEVEELRLTESAGCCAKFAKGGKAKKKEAELLATDERLRGHITMLSQVSQIQKLRRRPSMMLESEHQQHFWEEHFGNDSEISVERFVEALNYECKTKLKGTDKILDADALHQATDVVKTLFKKNENVTVLKFAEHFSSGMIHETMIELSKKQAAKTAFCDCIAIKIPTKEVDDSVRIGLVLVKEGDSLRGIRRSIVEFFQDTGREEEPDSDSELDDDDDDFSGPEYNFLRENRFTFHLNGGETQVRRKQETMISDPSITGKVWLSKEALGLKGAMRRAKNVSDASTVEQNPAPLPGQTEEDTKPPEEVGWAGEEDDEAIELDEDVSSKLLQAAQKAQAMDLTLDQVLESEELSMGLRQLLKRAQDAPAVKKGGGKRLENVTEDAVFLLVRVANMRKLAREAAGEYKDRVRVLQNKGAGLVADFMSKDSPMKIGALSEADRKSARDSWQTLMSMYKEDAPLPGFDTLMLNTFDSSFAAVAGEVAKPVRMLRKFLAKKQKVVRPLGLNQIRVVVAGAGGVGSGIAKRLDAVPNIHVTLCDPKEYYEDIVLMPHCAADPDTNDRWKGTVSKYTLFVRNGRIVQGAVVGVNTTNKYIEVGPSKEVVPYDHLILAMGSNYPSAIKTNNASMDYRERQMKMTARGIASSEHVLVVGGGLVAVELVGEILSKHPGKKVTVVQRAKSLLPRCPPKAGELAKQLLEDLGAEIIFDEEVVSTDPEVHQHTTNKGRVIFADKVFMCTGPIANTWMLRGDKNMAAALDEDGFVITDEHMRVPGLDGVWAVGDLAHWKAFPNIEGKYPERTLHVGFDHAIVTTYNLLQTARNFREDSFARIVFDKLRFKTIRENPIGLCISVGTKPGIAVMPRPAYEGFLTNGMRLGDDPAEDELVLKSLEEHGAALAHVQGLKSFYSGWIKQQFEMDLPYDGKPEAAMVKPAFEGDALGILGMSAGGSVAIGYMAFPADSNVSIEG